MFRAAGTDVVVDLLFFRRHAADEPANATRFLNEWSDVVALDAAFGARQIVVNRYWRANPDMVLGQHGMATNQFGPAYTCAPYGDPRHGIAGPPLEELLRKAIESFDTEPATQNPPQIITSKYN